MQVLTCVLDGRIPAALPGLWGALQAASPSCFHPISAKAHTSAHLSLHTQVRSLNLWCLAAAICIWHVEPFPVWHGMPFWLHLYNGGCSAPRKFVVNSVHHAQDGTRSSGRRAPRQCREWRCWFLCRQPSPLFSSLGRTAFSFIKWLIITLSFEHLLVLIAFSQFLTSTRELGGSDPSWACHSAVFCVSVSQLDYLPLEGRHLNSFISVSTPAPCI